MMTIPVQIIVNSMSLTSSKNLSGLRSLLLRCVYQVGKFPSTGLTEMATIHLAGRSVRSVEPICIYILSS